MKLVEYNNQLYSWGRSGCNNEKIKFAFNLQRSVFKYVTFRKYWNHMSNFLKILTLAVFILFTGKICAQHWQNEDLPLNRNYWGFALGLQLGPIDRYEISPLWCYRITPGIWTGLSGRYIFHNNKALNINIKSHVYGGALFGDFVVIRSFEKLKPFNFPGSLFLRGELEMLNLNVNAFDPGNHPGQKRFWKPGYLVGAGLRQVSKTGAGFFITVQYNLNDSKRLPYDNPVVKFGFVF